MSDAAAGGTGWKEPLRAIRLLYKENYMEEMDYKALVADVVSRELEAERITAEDSMLILLAHGVI